MKRKLQIKGVIVLFMAIFASVNMFAYDFEVDGIYYNKNADDTTVSVTYGTKKYSGAITIPTSVTYGGTMYSVTKIGDNAFANCTELVSIEMPNNVDTISYGAFWGCKGLTCLLLLVAQYNSCHFVNHAGHPKQI